MLIPLTDNEKQKVCYICKKGFSTGDDKKDGKVIR